ncbi:hypothetical protein BUALT_Bualt01G0182900 [Buddleja alternifolia]|uniref:Uncharacterized protein n=1 Tax=Buddleja alternifolia TaxID=168488 RepID=A0AAV6YE09_9LAMI|nr:hypothetical protein BUALT_Bualt01G0182900 [Buddleja alternifolia]
MSDECKGSRGHVRTRQSTTSKRSMQQPSTPEATQRPNVRSHEVAIAELTNLSSSRCPEDRPSDNQVTSLEGAHVMILDGTCISDREPSGWIRAWAVYEKNGNIFFRTTIPKATTSEQKQLDTAKARLQKLSSS